MATTATQTTNRGTEQGNAALSVLLQQLLAGGTRDMQQREARIGGEINANQALRARYSPEAALADSQGLIAQTLRQAMEKTLPSITRAAEGAGASGNALRALLINDANTRAAESASAVGVGAVQGYGGIGANLSQVLAGLVAQDSGSTEAILKAIELMQQQTTEVETEGGTSTGGVRGSSGGSSGGRSDSVLGMPSTDSFFFRPGGVLANAAQQRATGPTSFGPAVSDSRIADRIIAGLGPSQSLNDVQGINNLYRGGFSI